MAAKTTFSNSVPHFAESSSITTTMEVNATTGRWAYTNLDVRWIDSDGNNRLRTITSVSKDDAWRRARAVAQKLADQGLSPTISNAPERPLMMQLVDTKTGEISYKLRRYSMTEAAAIVRRLASSSKTPVFVMAPMV